MDINNQSLFFLFGSFFTRRWRLIGYLYAFFKGKRIYFCSFRNFKVFSSNFNIIINEIDKIKLLDFGTAHLVDPADAITQDGEFIGTFAYASPEQFRSSEIDHRADLYTLGVLLYRLATGRRPFKSEVPAELARMHTRQAPVPPNKHVPSIPDELNELILFLMQKELTLL